MNKIKPSNVHEILKKYILTDGYDFVLDLKKSKGSYLYDAKSKKWFLDFFTFFATSPLGCNHDKMLDKSFIKKLTEASINKPSNSDVYTIEMASFIDTFSRIAVPSFMKYLFFISGGALAVENALKTAMDWKVRKNFQKGINEEKGSKIIHFKEAFHGRSGYTLSLTNTFDPKKTKYFPKFDWPRITNPKILYPLNDENLKAVKMLEDKALKEIKSYLEKDDNDIAAIIIEPIQGEGGDNHFRKEFFISLREICKNNDILFILDEVQSGMGLTGKMWAFEHFDIEPDIICFGKKTQVSGIMVSNRIDDVENHVFRESSRINSTFGGSLTDMVRMEKYLEIIDEEDLVNNADFMGNYLINILHDIQSSYNSTISNVRGKGLMCAFDLPNTEIRDKLVKEIYNNGAIVLICGERSIRFRPALNIGKDEIDEAKEILTKSIKLI